MMADAPGAALPRTALSGHGTSAGRRASGPSHFTRTRVSWTIAIGAVGGLLFLLSHSMHRVQDLFAHKATIGDTLAQSAVAIGVNIVAALLLLLTVGIAERGDHRQPRAWLRYAVATVTGVAIATAIVDALLPFVPVDALTGFYGIQDHGDIDRFVFWNWLLFGGLAVFVYVRLSRARREQAAFEAAELARVDASREVLRSQLAAMQARVEPAFLFNALRQVEAQYQRDAGSGERALDDLIAYLRAALPQLRAEESTLAREAALAEAYLRIVKGRMGSRLEFAFDIPPALRESRFPPMLLQPLVEHAVRHSLEPLPLGGRIDVGAALHDGRLHVTVGDDGLCDASMQREDGELAALRERLALLYGHDALLVLRSRPPSGVVATLEVPAP